MSSIIIAATLAHFLAGLALFTLAGMTGSALGRAAGRRAVGWGLLAMIALGLAEWCDLAIGSFARPAVCQSARLALEMLALVGLIELGRLCTAGPRAGLLPRWSYPLVAGFALVAVWLARFGALEFALRLAICWQAGWLAASYLRSGKKSVAAGEGGMTTHAIGARTFAARAIVGGLLVYLLAACAAIPIPGMVAIVRIGPSTLAAHAIAGGPLGYLLAICVAIPLPGLVAALVAVVAAYLAFGPTLEESRQAQLRWRCAWPTGFLLIAVGGCLALAAAGVSEADLRSFELANAADGPGNLASADSASQKANDLSDNESGDDYEMSADRADPGVETAVVRQAKRISLGLSPIIVFVLLIWGLSRLPFVH